MAFKRKANAIVSKSDIHFEEWMDEIRKNNEGAVPKDYVGRVAKDVLRKCDPNKYLLSHATIVASVDVYAPQGVKTGKMTDNRGMEIEVKWPEYRIKPECQELINNNGDAWERSLLLSTYRTFIGAPNYLEHIQIPELSKGFIVDAIARDLGNTCYIDILVGTDRKHNVLIQDILSNKLNAMSMGCFVAGTKVTLADGSMISIEDIRPDMHVFSQKGNACRVKNLQIRENRWGMCEIKTTGHFKLSCTDNHKWYAVPREEVEYRSTYRKNQVPINKDYGFEYREAGDLKVGDIVAFPIPQKVVETDISESDARLIGIFAADGWKFENTHDSTIGLGFCLNRFESQTINDVVNKIEQIMWLSGENRMTANGHSCNRSVNSSIRRNACYLTSTSRKARNLIDEFVHGRTAKTKIFDEAVLCWPKNLQKALLSGYVDGDGSVSTAKRKTKNLHISSRNPDLINQLRLIAARCGLITTISKAKRKGTKLVPGGAGVDYQLRFMNNGVNQINANKLNDIEIKESLVGLNKRWITDKYIYTTVESIRRFDYDGFVYDMEVEGDHSYTVNGIGVSNCVSLFTICTHCGNVAIDDTQFCSHVAYDGKNSEFIDENGQKHRLAELIGHTTVPNSNQFIEASWVRAPAFSGAQRRNVLNAEMPTIATKIEAAGKIYEIKCSQDELEGILRAASIDPKLNVLHTAQDEEDDAAGSALDELMGGGDEEAKPEDKDEEVKAEAEKDKAEAETEGGEETPAEPAKPKIDKLVEKAQEQLLQTIVNDLSERLAPKPEDVGVAIPGIEEASYNDNLVRASQFDKRLQSIFKDYPKIVKWASRVNRLIHLGGRDAIKRAGYTPSDLIVFSWINDTVRSKVYPPGLYKLAMKIGPINSFPSETSYFAACQIDLNRPLVPGEKRFLRQKGRIASLSTKF